MKLNLSALMSVAACSAMAIGLTACIDDKYDLSDMDSTYQVTVKDLTVPVNLGAVTLRDVLDLEEGDDIKEMNGEYVVFQEGNISSDDINIDKIEIKTNAIEASTVDVHQNGVAQDVPSSLDVPAGHETFSYILKEPCLSDFDFMDNDVDYRIKSLDYINVDWSITFSLSVFNPDKTFNKFCFRNIRLEVPAGFVFGDKVKDLVVSATEIALPQIILTQDEPEYHITLPIVAIDFKRMEAIGVCTFTPGATQKAPSTFQIKGQMGVKSGEVLAVTDKVVTGASMGLVSAPSTTNITINSFTGNVFYDVEGINVKDIDLTSLPDFLGGNETNLILSNPQLYLTVNNPVGQFGGMPSSGLQLLPIRYTAQDKEVIGTPASLEKDFVIGCDKVEGPYQFCLAPKRPENFYEGYSGAEMIYFPALSTVLSGDGIPSKIRVNFEPCIKGLVTNFTLGTGLPKLDGKYVLYCPLSLGKGAKIVYASDETGWGEDVRKITIQRLNVTAVCNNDLPFDVTFRNCYPLDARGRRIEGVTINEVTVRSGQNQEINIEVTGQFSNFDGMHFEAVAVQTSEDTLKPSTELKLTDIRAKVTGYFIDKL